MKPWPTAIITSLSVFIAIQFFMVRLAVQGFEGPDDPNYYKMGLEYDRELERQQVQRHKGWQLEVQQRNPLKCRIIDRQGHTLTGEWEVTFKRPATRSQDQKYTTKPTATVYTTPWQATPGPWIVTFSFKSQGQLFRNQQRWHIP